MTALRKILPGTGRGTARSAVEGLRTLLQVSASPSTMLRMVPLPILGRNCA
jgi:hypothetical protein